MFALAEKQPGMAKVFFYLEQEAMKPRYEIHSLGMPEIVEPVPGARVEQRDRAARALFAATEMVSGNEFETEFGRAVPYGEVRGVFGTLPDAATASRCERLATVFTQDCGADLQACADCSKTRCFARRIAGRLGEQPAGATRALGTGKRNSYAVSSAGPDKQFDTADDLTGYLEVRGRNPVGRPSSGASRIDSTIEHDRGPFNGLAEITGTVVDQQGGAVEGAAVTARERIRRSAAQHPRRMRMASSRLAGIPAGEYDVKVSNGAASVSRRITLEVRDRGVLSAMLRQADSGTVVVAVIGRGAGGGIGARRFRNFDGPMAGMIGGGAGGAAGDVMMPMRAKMAMVAAPMAAPPAPMAMARSIVTRNASVVKAEPAAPEAHIRSYFPEALYINPEIITDQNGAASITIPLADSITTWRMALVASTIHGALGSGVSSLKVFQDFFVDLDLPVTLTQGDRVSIPVAVYNYSAARGDVQLDLKKEDWFTLVEDNAGKRVAVDAGQVGGAQFTIEAQRIGKFKLTLAAHMSGGNNPADIVVREIEVVPNGREQNVVFNGRLETSAEHEVNFPPAAIADASKLFVRLYPGPLSQVVEGMDAILRMPFGCFEQTSSATYPNVLALDYMKRTKKLTPEVHAKAEGFIANGYQRLLTFEVPGRRILVVRQCARQQDFDGIRADGVLRYGTRA